MPIDSKFKLISNCITMKISMYLGTSPLPLPPVPPQIGFWAVLHEIRSEYAQLMTTLFLFIAGSGRCSLDSLLVRNAQERHGHVYSERGSKCLFT